MDKALDKFLISLGCRRREEKYILDGLHGSEFYLLFDATLDTDNPKPSTCDIIMCKVASDPRDTVDQIRAVADATAHKVMRFLFALGVDRFSESTRKFLYESNSVIRAQ